MRIAVVGAGPAGSHLAHQLVTAGHRVRLYDMHRGAWEKPCGGGVTAKALRQFDFLMKNVPAYPRQTIDELELIAPSGRAVTVRLDTAFVIFSRRTLNAQLLDRACEAGAEFVPERVTDIAPDGTGWRIVSEATGWTADFLVGADGCTSLVRRRLLGKLPDEDQGLCCGYYIPSPGTNRAVIAFPKDFTGYVWAFPRVDHISYGIINACHEYPIAHLWDLLDQFVRRHSGAELPEERTKYAARVPMLRQASWQQIRAGGERWALVGDAAGFVDPITGEGIYYALRSAELLARDITAGHPAAYEHNWRRDFEAELTQSSRRLARFYRGTIFGGPVIERTIWLSSLHGGIQHILSQALAGDVDHTTLKNRLVASLFKPSTWFGRRLKSHHTAPF